MKLWHIAQWGNKEDGVNGWDTQCVVAAPNLAEAVKFAEARFQDYNGANYAGGIAHCAFLMGDDGEQDGEACLVLRVWVSFGDNPGNYPSWHRHPETDEWLDTETMYGEEQV
jgi:hypothetical protein